MLFVRYFVFAGGALLALLILADWYFPASRGAVADNDIDRSIIRIRSSHRWPNAVQIDTSAPMPVARVVADAAVASASVDGVGQAYAFDPPRPQTAPERPHRRAKLAHP